MAARSELLSGIRALSRPSLLSPVRTSTTRKFQTSTRRLQEAATPVRKPVGAFRGGMLGFFAGSTLAGAGVYFYILDEYRISNQMLSEDIYALRAAVQRTEAYTRTLEEKVVQMQSKQIQDKK